MNSDGFAFGIVVPGNLSVQSDGSSVVSGNIPQYVGTSGLVITDSGISTSSLSGYLPLSGGTMSGDIDMAGNDIINTGIVRPRDDNTDDIGTSAKRYKSIYASGQLVGTMNSRSTNDIVSSSSSPSVIGNVATFTDTTGTVIQDSGSALSGFVTNPLSSALDCAGFDIDNVGNVFLATDNTVDLASNSNNFKDGYFKGNISNFQNLYPGVNFVSLGQSSSSGVEGVAINGTAGNFAIAIGYQSNAAANGCVIGNASSGTYQETVVGNSSSTDLSAQGTNIFGYNNQSTSGGASIWGTNLTNNVANSLLMDSTAVTPYTNIRTAQDNKTDLGTSANQFKDVYVGGSLIGSSGSISVPISSIAQNPAQSDLVMNNFKVTMSTFSPAVCMFSGNIATVNSTTTETSIVSSGLGSLVLAAGQAIGLNVQFTFYLQVSSTAGDTLTLRLKNQSGVLYTNAITVSPGATNALFRVEGSMIVQASTVQVNSVTRTVTLNYITSQNSAYDPSIQNTLDFTLQWGSNTNTCTVNEALVTAYFING